jgi:hypothetical protein
MVLADLDAITGGLFLALTALIVAFTTILQTWYQEWRRKIDAENKRLADEATAEKLALKVKEAKDKAEADAAVIAAKVAEVKAADDKRHEDNLAVQRANVEVVKEIQKDVNGNLTALQDKLDAAVLEVATLKAAAAEKT